MAANPRPNRFRQGMSEAELFEAVRALSDDFDALRVEKDAILQNLTTVSRAHRTLQRQHDTLQLCLVFAPKKSEADNLIQELEDKFTVEDEGDVSGCLVQ